MRTFSAATWGGHTRSLTVGSDGRGTESVGDGCCHPIVDLTFQVGEVTGTPSRATAEIEVTSVVIHDRSAWSAAQPAPRVGQHGQLRLLNRVVTETVTGDIYCDEHDPPEPWVCGA